MSLGATLPLPLPVVPTPLSYFSTGMNLVKAIGARGDAKKAGRSLPGVVQTSIPGTQAVKGPANVNEVWEQLAAIPRIDTKGTPNLFGLIEASGFNFKQTFRDKWYNSRPVIGGSIIGWKNRKFDMSKVSIPLSVFDPTGKHGPTEAALREKYSAQVVGSNTPKTGKAPPVSIRPVAAVGIASGGGPSGPVDTPRTQEDNSGIVIFLFLVLSVVMVRGAI